MAKESAAAAAMFAILAVIMTWPLAAHLGTAVSDPGDPFINTWILDWDWWATLHQPLSLFSANAFHPSLYPLAYSENLYGIALLLFPLRGAGAGPIAAHNAAILLGFFFSGFAAWLLGRRIGAPFWAATAAGIFYAFVPFRITHIPHVQHVWGGWLPMLLVALLAYAEKPSWPRAAAFGGVYLINGLSNIHWLLFGTVAIALTALLVIRRRVLPLLVATAVALLLLAPFLYPYLEVARVYGMRRSWSETLHYSAQLRDWLVSSPHTRFCGALADARVDPELWLFPGALAIAFAVAAPFARRSAATSRRPIAIAFLWLLLGIAGSLGLHFVFHRFLFAYVPGFQAIRVPARWAGIAYVGLSMLIALAAAAIPRRWQWMAAAAFAIELFAAPLRLYSVLPDAPPADRWLAENADGGAVVELPMVQSREYVYLLRATAHHRPLLNGVSGFEPPTHAIVQAMTAQQQVPDALLPVLQRAGCRFLLVHSDDTGYPLRDWLRRECDRGHIGLLRRFDSPRGFGDWLFVSGARMPRTNELEAFLRGYETENESTFGWIVSPQTNASVKGSLTISGAAFSHAGIREVTLLLDNGRVRRRAQLVPDAILSRKYPWYPKTPSPRFELSFTARPPGVHRLTDVQAEIIDGAGNRTLSEDRWFEWR